jgi:hypothetical protein
MDFFDPKEDVLEVKLTPWGRYKLSKGGFRPVWYAFFDEGILYNSDFARTASAPGGESQNNIHDRIMDETPRLKPFNVTDGIQTAITRRNEAIQKIFGTELTAGPAPTYDPDGNLIITEQDIGTGPQIELSSDPLFMEPGDVYNREELQYTTNKMKALENPLGTSKLSSDKNPAWAVKTYLGEISSSLSYFRGDDGRVKATIAVAIDTNGFGAASSDGKFALLITTAAGGEGASTSILLDEDQTTNPDNDANTIGIGCSGESDASVAALIIKAINGTSHDNIKFASSGKGMAGYDSGITATQGSSNTQITLTMKGGGTAGNIYGLVYSSGFDVVDTAWFGGGTDTLVGSTDAVGSAQLIPQINIVARYNTYVGEIPGYSVDMGTDAADFFQTEATNVHNLEAVTTGIMPEGFYLVIEKGELVLGIEEKNADFYKENFDIEVMLSSSAADIDTTHLKFNNSTNPVYSPDDVQYYLTLNTDNEIGSDILQKANIQDFTALGAGSSGTISTRQYFVKDLYSPEEDLCEE